MNHDAKALQDQIDVVIKRLQEIQRDIAGSQQPASHFELESLKALGRTYEKLSTELQQWYSANTTGNEKNG